MMITTNSDRIQENKATYYRIADHLLEIDCPEQVDIQVCLPSFSDFLVDKPDDSEPIIQVNLRVSAPEGELKNRRLLSDISQRWGDRFRFEESEEVYLTSVRDEEKERFCEMHSEKDFRRSTVYMDELSTKPSSILSWMLMVVYAQAVLPYKSIVIHASVVKQGGQGYAFLGKSGTGKSTHSRLWLKHIEDTELLNDDNPIIRIDNDGRVRIYGSPWSGKTACYRPENVDLKALVRLRQATYNRWTELENRDALLAILPSCSSIRWNRDLYSKMVDAAEGLIKAVQVAYLDCLPNAEAAHLCYRKINK